jgi:hypothetical protein
MDKADVAAREHIAGSADLVAAIRLLAETEGMFAETAGGVTIANLVRFARAGHVGRDERTLVAVMRAKQAVRFWVVEPDGAARFLTWVAVVGRVMELAKGGADDDAAASEWILHPVPGPDTDSWPDELLERIDEAIDAHR